MTYDRAKFRKQGCWFTDIGEKFHWKDSYHEGESTQFITSKTNWKCDECDKKFIIGDLISVGNRQFYPDAPIYITGIDRVHYKCYVPDDFEKDPKNALFCKIIEVDGYGALNQDDKTRWLKWQGMEVNDANLNYGDVAALKGMVFVVIGIFDNKEAIRTLINKNGGGLSSTYTRDVTHCVLGKSGKSKYGQKTGKGSKIYKTLKKKKIPILSVDELNEMIQTATKEDDETDDKDVETKKKEDDSTTNNKQDEEENEDIDLDTSKDKNGNVDTKENDDVDDSAKDKKKVVKDVSSNSRKRKVMDEEDGSEKEEEAPKPPARKRRRPSRRK